MKIKLLWLLVMFLTITQLNAQDLRSVKSGNWGEVTTWERKSGANWVVATDIPRSASSVIIQSQHQVVLTQDIAPTCSNLTIEKGAVLKGVGVPTLRIGTGKNSTDFKLINNGKIESGANAEEGLIRLDIFNTAQKFNISGDGETNFGRLTARGGNPNKLEITIDANLNITEKISTSNFSAMDNLEDRRSPSDDVTITIEKGRTVKILNQSTFHSPIAAVEKGGKYTYNILGVLDISENNNANHLVAAASNPTSAVNLIVGGQLILGQSFNVQNKNPSTGSVVLKVLDGGVVDATKTKRMFLGANQFTTVGTGIVKR